MHNTGVSRTTLAWPSPSKRRDPHGGAYRLLATGGLGPGLSRTRFGVLARSLEKVDISALRQQFAAVRSAPKPQDLDGNVTNRHRVKSMGQKRVSGKKWASPPGDRTVG